MATLVNYTCKSFIKLTRELSRAKSIYIIGCIAGYKLNYFELNFSSEERVK